MQVYQAYFCFKILTFIIFSRLRIEFLQIFCMIKLFLSVSLGVTCSGISPMRMQGPKHLLVLHSHNTFLYVLCPSYFIMKKFWHCIFTSLFFCLFSIQYQKNLGLSIIKYIFFSGSFLDVVKIRVSEAMKNCNISKNMSTKDKKKESVGINHCDGTITG